MLHFRLGIVCVLAGLFLSSLRAQPVLEGYAEFGFWGGTNEVAEPNRDRYDGGGGFSLGADVLVGKKQLSPLVGLHYARFGYERSVGPAVEQLYLQQLTVPLGLAYFLRPRSTSFNLRFSGAYAPYLRINDPETDIVADRDLTSSFRFGTTLTLDYVYLGWRGQWFANGRFGTTDDWLWYHGGVIGIRF